MWKAKVSKHKLTLGYLSLLLLSCAGSQGSLFLNTEFKFNSIETVAVIPFENLSDDQGAAMRITRVFVAELLARKAFDIVEPGEVSRVLEKLSLVRTADLQKDQVKDIAKALGVQAIFLGSVTESTSGRNGGSSANEVTLSARLIETEKATTIWSATHTEGGRSFFQVLFGLEPDTKSQVTMDCVKRLIKTLIH